MEQSVKSKADLRKQILGVRKQLLPEQKKKMDEALFLQVQKLSWLHHVRTVYCYASVRGEAETGIIASWLRKQGIRTAFPRVNGAEMDFYYCDSIRDLQTGTFGILEPTKHCGLALEREALVLVPGVAFSMDLHRIGYGAGYYDRFFEKEPFHKKVGICYNFQVFPEFTVESTDVAMDLLITETGFLGKPLS